MYINRLADRKARKRERSRKRMERRLQLNAPICSECGRVMSWCSVCRVYSQDCCVDWGTCMCS